MILGVGIIVGLLFLITSSIIQNTVNLAYSESAQGSQDLVPAKLSIRFQLKIDQTAFIESGNIRVTFLNVTEDSRCPADAVCVQEGQVTVLFNVMHNEEDLGDFELTIRGGGEGMPIKTFDGYSIQLMKVDPYPFASQPTELSDYVITLLISESEPELNRQFQLKIGQTASIESKNIKLRFLNVTEDSRCPSDVVCVWEGQVTILLNIMHNDQDLGDLGLTLAATAFVAGYSIQLTQVEPYPKAGEPTKLSDYVVTLLVSKISSSESNTERVYVKAVGGRDVTHNEVINSRLLGSWNLDKGKGTIVIFADGERDVWHLIPRIANCVGLTESDECIISPIIIKEFGLPMDVNLEVDKENMQLFMKLLSKDETEIVLNIKEVKTWSANGIITAKSTLMLTEGQRNGPLLVQQIYPDRIEGLNFVEYPLAREEGIPITLHTGETVSNGCTVKLTLVEIHDEAATFLKTVDMGKPCPICWHDKS